MNTAEFKQNSHPISKRSRAQGGRLQKDGVGEAARGLMEGLP